MNKDQYSILATLKVRFEANMNRHKDIKWEEVLAKISANPQKDQKLMALNEMEKAGHEPDVVGTDSKTGEIIFFSCSTESPLGHRNIVYDKAVQDWFIKNHPNEKCNGNAFDVAKNLGVQILNQDQYIYLQSLGQFDFNSQSWVKTPDDMRCAEVFLIGSRNGVNVGADIYDALPYASKSFRGVLKV